jgi:putative acetyltransferase
VSVELGGAVGVAAVGALDGVILRRARVDDAADYAALMNDPAVYPGVLQLPWSDASVWRDRLAAPGGAAVPDLHLVAVYEHHVIGAAGLYVAAPHVRRRHAMTVWMTVAGPWQGRGVGTMLLGALCQHADRWVGALRLELTVYTDNAAAIALYRKFGFEIEGTHRAFAVRDGRYVDAHAMARLHPKPPAWSHA